MEFDMTDRYHDMTDREIASEVVTELMTNGFGDIADRLVLVTSDGRELGGWSRKGLVFHIEAVFSMLKDSKCNQQSSIKEAHTEQ